MVDLIPYLRVDVMTHDSACGLGRLRLENALLIPDLRGAHLIFSHRFQQAIDLVTFVTLHLLKLLAPLVCLLLIVLPLLNEG